MRQLSLFDQAPAQLDPDAEVEALIAEITTIEMLTGAGRAALTRIGARADALGAINLGTYIDGLLSLGDARDAAHARGVLERLR